MYNEEGVVNICGGDICVDVYICDKVGKEVNCLECGSLSVCCELCFCEKGYNIS